MSGRFALGFASRLGTNNPRETKITPPSDHAKIRCHEFETPASLSVALAFAGIGRAPVPTNARTPPTSPPPQLAPSGAPVRQASTAPQQPLLRVAAARPAATSSPPPSTPFLAAALADDSSSGEEEAVGGGAIN